MAETAEELRRSLAELRLERGAAKPPRQRPRWRLVAAAVVVVVAALAGLRLARGRSAIVEVTEARAPAATEGGGTDVPVDPSDPSSPAVARQPNSFVYRFVPETRHDLA